MPSNTTSKVQPIDARIIAWVKKRYNSRLLSSIFENIDAGRKSIFNVGILTVMRWVTEEWLACTDQVIMNCLDHCFMQGGQVVESGEEDENATLNSMSRDALKHEVWFKRASVKNLLYQCDENTVIEEVKIEDLGRAGVPDNEDELQGTVELDAIKKEIESPKVQLYFLRGAKASLERCGRLFDACRKAIIGCQRELRIEKQQS